MPVAKKNAHLSLQSGTINVPGGKQALGSGGVILDDNQANGKSSTRPFSLLTQA
jgi:hypothetical protein